MGQAEGQVDQCRQRERRRDHAEGGHAGQPARDDHRPGRVAEGDEADLSHGAQVADRHVEPDQGGHAQEPQREAAQAAEVGPVVPARQPPEQGAYRGHGRDEESGEGAREPPLGVGQEEPGEGDLHGRVEEDPPPVRKQGPEGAPGSSQRDQQHGADGGAEEDQGDRAQVGHRHPDE